MFLLPLLLALDGRKDGDSVMGRSLDAGQFGERRHDVHERACVVADTAFLHDLRP
jgi:hypothetical protein